MKEHTSSFRSIIWIVSIFAVMALVGCGGSDNNSYDPLGLIYGVKVLPSDGTTGIGVGEDVFISWPEASYPEPASFTFKMEEENSSGGWTGVYTDNIGSTFVSGIETWRFRPVDYLTYYTWFRVTITDDTGRKQVVMFRSAAAPAVTAQSTKSDKSASKGAVEHRIQVK